MTDDSLLANRIRALLAPQPALSERRMFGGIGFMLGNNLCCGIHRHQLVARLGPDQACEALAQPHVRPFDVTGRPMHGWVFIEPAGYASDAALRHWLDQCIAFVATLPAAGRRPPRGQRRPRA